MPNELQIECFFKSAEIEKLCKTGDHIMINIKAHYTPDSPPTFQISAANFTEGVNTSEAGKTKAKTSAAALSAEGCPKPCS